MYAINHWLNFNLAVNTSLALSEFDTTIGLVRSNKRNFTYNCLLLINMTKEDYALLILDDRCKLEKPHRDNEEYDSSPILSGGKFLVSANKLIRILDNDYEMILFKPDGFNYYQDTMKRLING